MPTATPASCTPNWRRAPSTTPYCPITGRITSRRRTRAWSWCRALISPLYDLTEAQTIDYSALDSFVVVICVEGKGTLCDDSGNEMPIHQGETVLLPATVKSLRVIPGGNLKMLTSYIK